MRNFGTILMISGVLAGMAAPDAALAQYGRSSTSSRGRAADLIRPTADADKLSRSGKPLEAITRFETVWNNLRKQDQLLLGADAPYVADTIRNFCRRYSPARDRFRTMRDRAADSFEERGKQLPDLAAWIVLNRIVEQEDRTLEWWEKVKAGGVSKAVLTRFRPWLEPLLEKNGRLGDLAVMIDDPAGLVRREYAGFRAAVRHESSELNYRVAREVFLTRHARHYASLLLAGRDRDATRLATEAMTVDHSPEMVACMVKSALDCGKAGPQHMDWLSAVGDRASDLEDLKARLHAELAESGSRPDGKGKPGQGDSPSSPRHGGPITTAAVPSVPSISSTDPPLEP